MKGVVLHWSIAVRLSDLACWLVVYSPDPQASLFWPVFDTTVVVTHCTQSWHTAVTHCTQSWHTAVTVVTQLWHTVVTLHTAVAVLTQSWHTVVAHCRDSRDSILTHCRDSPDSVVTHCRDTLHTVKAHCRESRDTQSWHTAVLKRSNLCSSGMFVICPSGRFVNRSQATLFKLLVRKISKLKLLACNGSRLPGECMFAFYCPFAVLNTGWLLSNTSCIFSGLLVFTD